MSTKYSYDKSVYTSYLMTEINDSTISVNLSYIHSSEYLTDIYMESELPPDDETALNTIVANHNKELCGVKDTKITAIQRKTEIEEGYGVPYNNYYFSVTPSAKSNWLGLIMAKDSLSYPYAGPTGFDATYLFQDSTDITNFFGTSLQFLSYWEQSNEVLKISVKDCTSVEQVNAIADDRTYPPS